jgi:alpha-D-ribose 1-methylphosphonate 5-triphosphate diphosphatase PhnM
MPGWADWWADLLGTPVPTPICDLMFEVYTAVQANSRRLAAMGIRATLDAVMVDKVGDQVTFKDTADAFEKAGYLSVRQRGHLDAILEAGHAAIHRGWEPTDDDIITLLDIAESIIETAYLHEQAAKTLDGKVPPRPPRPGRVAR